MSGIQAELNPNQPTGRTSWMQVPVFEPVPWMEYSQDGSIGYFTRDYTATYSNQTANQEQTLNFRFDRDAVVIALCGAACKTDSSNLPVGMQSLDTFSLKAETVTGDRLIQTSTLGSAVVGTGAWPRKIAFGCWRCPTGTTLQFFSTPLLATLRVDLVLQVVETFAGQNFRGKT